MNDIDDGKSLRDTLNMGGGWLVGAGIVTILFGILCILSPYFASGFIVTMVGIFLILASGIQIAEGIHLKKGTQGRGWVIFAGILGVLFGLFLVARPLHGVAILTFVLAVFLIVEGVLGTAGALDLKPQVGWGWMLFSAIMSIIVGLMLWTNFPDMGAWAIGTFFGIHMIFLGVAHVQLGRAARKAASL